MERLQILLENLNAIQAKNSRTYHHSSWLVSKEYFRVGDHQNALQIATKVLSFYKKEGWIDLMIAVIDLGIRAAYYSGNVIEFIKLGLEALGAWNSYLSAQQKVLIQESIMDLFELKPPLKLDFLAASPEQQEQALRLFTEHLGVLQEDQQFVIKMSKNVSSFVDAKVAFERDQVYADQPVNLVVYLFVRSPEPIRFDRLRLLFAKDYYNRFCTREISDEPLMPGRLYEFQFKITPNPPDGNQQLELDRLELSLGPSNFRITCEWEFRSDCYASHFTDYNSNANRADASDELKFRCIQNRPSTFLNFKQPRIDFRIEHNESALFDENFAFNLSLVNNELDDLRNLELYIRQYKEQNDYEELLNEFACVDCDLQVLDKAKFIKISLTKHLKKGGQLNKTIFMRSKTNANLILDFSITYFVRAVEHPTESGSSAVYHTCTLKRSLSIATYFPFENIFLVQNLLKTNDNYWPKALEPFYLQVKIIANAAIQISSIDFLLNTNNFVLEDHDGDLGQFNSNSALSQKSFQPGEELLEFVKLHCKHESANKLNLGVLILRWKRMNDKLSISPLNETRILLPEFTIKPSLLFIESNFPAFGYIKRRFNVQFKIFNRTELYLPILFTIEDNINFLYSGNKQVGGYPKFGFRTIPRFDQYQCL